MITLENSNVRNINFSKQSNPDQIRFDILRLWRGNVVLLFASEGVMGLLRDNVEHFGCSPLLQFCVSVWTFLLSLLRTALRRGSIKLKDCEAESCIELLVPDLKTLAAKWCCLTAALCLRRLAAVEVIKCGNNFFFVGFSESQGVLLTISFLLSFVLSALFSSFSTLLHAAEWRRLFSLRRNWAFCNWCVIFKCSSSACFISSQSSSIRFCLKFLVSWC